MSRARMSKRRLQARSASTSHRTRWQAGIKARLKVPEGCSLLKSGLVRSPKAAKRPSVNGGRRRRAPRTGITRNAAVQGGGPIPGWHRLLVPLGVLDTRTAGRSAQIDPASSRLAPEMRERVPRLKRYFHCAPGALKGPASQKVGLRSDNLSQSMRVFSSYGHRL
jgi:hypothetical protein